MPRGKPGTGTTMPRTRSGTKTPAATPIGQRAAKRAIVAKTLSEMFTGSEWIALPANNPYGFVLFSISGGDPAPIMKDADAILQAFAWHLLHYDGLLKSGGVGLAAVARTTRAARNGSTGRRRVPVTRVAVGAGSQTSTT